MGCACALHKDMSPDQSNEDVVKGFEKSINWAKFSAAKIVEGIVAVSVSDLTAKEVGQLFARLKLTGPNFRDKRSPVTHLFNSMSENKRVVRGKLVMLAVMLGSGHRDRKCELLEDFYKTEFSEVNIRSLLSDACDLALRCLPAYVQTVLESIHDRETMSKLSKYVEKLKQVKSEFEEYLIEKFLTNPGGWRFTKERFREKMRDEELGCVICASAMRLLALKPRPVSQSPAASPKKSLATSPKLSLPASPKISPAASPNLSPTASPKKSPTASPKISPTTSPKSSPVRRRSARFLSVTTPESFYTRRHSATYLSPSFSNKE